MAYFTREKMLRMALEMYEDNKYFLSGQASHCEADIRLLIACQQKALVVGEYIESLGMDYSNIVALFEDYCNHIYNICENLNDTEYVKNQALSIASLLVEIIDAVEKQIVEIRNIDVFDFRGLVDTKREKTLVSNEINRLYDVCINSDDANEESEEYQRAIVVGTY